MKLSISTKIIGLWLLQLFVIIGILSFFSYQNSYEELEDKFGLVLMQIANTASFQIKSEENNRLQKRGDEKRKEFIKIRDILQKVKMATGLNDDTIYTFRLGEQNELHFATMLHKKPFVGDVYIPPKENLSIFKKVFQGQSAYTKIYEDKNGKWVSGMAPLKDKSGRVIGILEVDYKVDKFVRELDAKVDKLLLITGIVVVISIILSFYVTFRLSSPIKQLSSAAAAIENQKYQTRVNIKSKDEIGDLAKIFNRMANSIQKNSQIMEEKNTKLKILNQKIELANINKSKFLRYLSHEMYNPLNILSGLESIENDKLDEESKSILKLSERAIERLIGVVTNVIKYFDETRLETPLKIEKFLLDGLIHEIIQERQEKMNQRKIKIVVKIYENIEVSADKNTYRTIVQSVLDNAITYTGPNGSIIIKATRTTDNKTLLAISDNGPGIDKKYLTGIFDAFFLEQINRGSNEGFGLNLPTAKVIAEAHGGKIWAESTGSNNGATFLIEI